MKKKIMAILLVATMSLSLTACGGSDNAETKDNTESSTESEIPTEEDEEVTTERDFPEGDYSDTGAGTFSIQTDGGDSADGSTPVLFASTDDVLIQIGYTAEGMDGNHLSFIYIDGMEAAKEQLGEMVQGSIDLQESFLEEGIHKIEVVQYDTDSSDGTIITYKTCSYEVKSK